MGLSVCIQDINEATQGLEIRFPNSSKVQRPRRRNFNSTSINQVNLERHQSIQLVSKGSSGLRRLDLISSEMVESLTLSSLNKL